MTDEKHFLYEFTFAVKLSARDAEGSRLIHFETYTNTQAMYKCASISLKYSRFCIRILPRRFLFIEYTIKCTLYTRGPMMHIHIEFVHCR